MTEKTLAPSRRWLNVGCLTVAACLLLLTAAHAVEERPANPQEMFRMLGVGDIYFERLKSGVAVDVNETDTVLRILFKLRRFPAFDMQRWAIDVAPLLKTIEQADKHRGSIFRLRGRVVVVEPYRPSADESQRYEMPQYFRCHLLLDSSSQMVDIYTENVPAEWQKGARPGAPGGALGVFLKFAKEKDQPTSLVFVAPRLAWYPDDLLSGALGMDYGLLDDLQNQKDLGVQQREAIDREAFYQMLAAVGRAKPGELLRQADADLPKIREGWRWTNREGRLQYSVVPLFNEPATQVGRLVALSGAARRVVKVSVDNPETVARFGFDHYFQVSLFTDDSQGNPLTFCVRELPKGMPYGNQPHYGESVRIVGFFYMTWSYGVQTMTDPALTPDPKTHHQLSPLLIGQSLVWYPVAKPADSTFSTAIIIGLVVVVMVIVWAVAWRSRRRERQWVEHAIGATPTLDPDVNFGQVDQSVVAAPDFDHIAEMDHGPEQQENS